MRRSSDSSVAYSFGTSIGWAPAVRRDVTEAAAMATRRDVRDDVELLAGLEQRLFEREVVARRHEQLVRCAALAQQRWQRGKEPVDRAGTAPEPSSACSSSYSGPSPS